MNIHPTSYSITQTDREKINGHKSIVIWFTGLSASGKTSITQHCDRLFFEKGMRCFPLDGDNIRTGINADLGFSPQNRGENIRRIAEIAKLMIQSGNIVLASFISPFAEDRELAKKIIGENHFFEVYIDTPIELCKKRDPKGLYKKATQGEITNFTGIDSPYEAPTHPDLIISTTNRSIEDCSNEVLSAVLPLLKLD